MLRIPDEDLGLWVKELADECMASSEERGMIYTRAAQYYYQGTWDQKAAIYNKTKPFIDKLAGFLMQPTDVRFAMVYDTSQDDSVLERAQLVSEKLSADYRNTDSDVTFAETVVWSLINGCAILKHIPTDDYGFSVGQVHPQNFGVLAETTMSLDEQEAFCHVSYPTISRLRSILQGHKRYRQIMEQVEAGRRSDRDAEETPSYFHAMVVGGLQPLGDVGSSPRSEAAGIVNVFPVPTPWRPNRKLTPTVKLCELWVKDRDRDGDYTVIQCIYGDEPIIIEGDDPRRNISKIPGRHPFVKVQAQPTPGYFWGRSWIADVQMLQDVLNRRMRDNQVAWERNSRAPQVFSGFTSITEEQYFKIINEGGFINDPNPNAKSQKLLDVPPPNYLEELQFLFQLFDEAAGFTPVMSGQGEPGVRAGVHAQTLVRTSTPRLIDQAARIERQLAESGYLCLRVMQAMDAHIYTTGDSKIEFTLHQIPDDFQVQVDSHSASPAFAEDNRQIAIALARAQAIDSEDLIHMLHPPGADLLLSRLRQRKKQQAQAAQQEEAKETMRDVLQLPNRQQGRGGGRRRRG
jgi:hypothetical protein